MFTRVEAADVALPDAPPATEPDDETEIRESL
jgi:hypothetical protein